MYNKNGDYMDIAIVTGASSGIGREFVFELHKWQKVDEVWVIARNKAKLEELKLITQLKLNIIILDLTKELDINKYKKMLEEKKPNVKLLINCAGFGKFGVFNTISYEDEVDMINLNIKALVLLTRYTLPFMKEKAKIINVASRAAFQPLPYMAIYQASKSFVLDYTKDINYELKYKGIRAIALCPNFVDTNFIPTAKKSDTKNIIKNYGEIVKADVVVKKCYHDLYKTKKNVSVYGFKNRFELFLMRFLPKDITLKIFDRMQGYPLKKKKKKKSTKKK